MKAKYAFIPCAGRGSRMGPIGELIPKPLWPFYTATLLEHQLNYCIELGIKNFIINTHHLADSFKSLKKKKGLNIEILYEEKLLGSGGSFHNIRRNFPEIEEVYIFNPDTFLFLNTDEWREFFSYSKECIHLLMKLPCQGEDKYNRFLVDNSGKLRKIIPYAENDIPLFTYAGLGKIDLRELTPQEGVSSFFESVAIPARGNIDTYELKEFEYWDLGTLDLYKKAVVGLLKERESEMYKFLKRHGLEQKWSSSYCSELEDCYNFMGSSLASEERGIYIAGPTEEQIKIPLE